MKKTWRPLEIRLAELYRYLTMGKDQLCQETVESSYRWRDPKAKRCGDE